LKYYRVELAAGTLVHSASAEVDVAFEAQQALAGVEVADAFSPLQEVAAASVASTAEVWVFSTLALLQQDFLSFSAAVNTRLKPTIISRLNKAVKKYFFIVLILIVNK
jgi:hypothetical protein